MADTLTITDNRTGTQYVLPITNGTIRALDLRQVKVDPDEFGMMSYDPAFLNTASCRSSVTFIDGDKGDPAIPGLPDRATGRAQHVRRNIVSASERRAPTTPQLDAWTDELKQHMMLYENIKKFMEGFRYDAHPMGVFLSTVGALSTFYPDAKLIFDEKARRTQVARLIAKVPSIAAYSFRHSMGQPYIYPDNDLSFVGNFLSMLFRRGEARFKPDPVLERALDMLFILHADHEQNCSTSAMRNIGSSHADPFASLAGAAGALYGPLHGGANEAVLRMLTTIGSIDNVPAFVNQVKNGEGRLIGFGHRVYKSYDPRAKVIKEQAHEVFEVTGKNPLLDVALELERIALQDDYFVSRRLYPNVDFYSGLIYEAMGFKPAMFPVLFAIGRTAGWIAQWQEMLEDKEQKIARPRQIYIGEGERDYVPADKR